MEMLLKPIPTDLIIEILPRLPEKSIVRFYCVSKLWESMLHGPYFRELFLTKSRARPRLLFGLEHFNEWGFYSSHQPHDQYEKTSSSLVVDADFHIKFPRVNHPWYSGCRESPYGYASGLIYFPDMVSYEHVNKRVILNPSTGQFAILPEEVIVNCVSSCSFLGFDPIDKQFKVLLLGYTYFGINDHRVLTLGTGELKWRKIQCPLTHEPFSKGICISGVLYYFAEDINETLAIVCFDVRSENFEFIYPDCFRDPFMFNLIEYKNLILINYKGKLSAIISLENDVYDTDAIELYLCIWVLEDAEKQEWSKHFYTLPKEKIGEAVSVVGITARGEFVLAMESAYKPFYVCYFDPERNTFQRVKIQGFETTFEKTSTVYACVDHVEDLNANDAKLFKSSIYCPSLKDIIHCQ